MGLITVVVASDNEAKLSELQAWLEDLPVDLVPLSEVLPALHLTEEGDTFESSAISRAERVSRASAMVTIAECAGLEVQALGGRPGLRSIRFAHDRATDAENNAALLRELEEVGGRDRAARFRCVLALASPWWSGPPRLATGVCTGTIASTLTGSGGFGYDPLFLVEELDNRAMATLSAPESASVNHRARAIRALRPLLFEVLDGALDVVERALG